MSCRFRQWDDCLFEDFDENEDYSSCSECPHYEEADEFIGYVEWLKDQDAKLRHQENMNG